MTDEFLYVISDLRKLKKLKNFKYKNINHKGLHYLTSKLPLETQNFITKKCKIKTFTCLRCQQLTNNIIKNVIYSLIH